MKMSDTELRRAARRIQRGRHDWGRGKPGIEKTALWTTSGRVEFGVCGRFPWGEERKHAGPPARAVTGEAVETGGPANGAHDVRL